MKGLTEMTPEELEAHTVKVLRGSIKRNRKTLDKFARSTIEISKLQERAIFICCGGSIPLALQAKAKELMDG